MERIKDAVSDSLRSADPAASIVRTSHFNHTYSPDLVLEWPGDPSQDPRPVFLRATQQVEILTEDVALHADQRPIFVHLDDLSGGTRTLPEEAERDDMELQHAAAATRTLVTEVASIEAFTGDRSATSAQLLAPSMLRGGRGWLEEPEALAVSQSVSNGFRGAQEADASTTALAIQQIDEYLDVREAVKLQSVLEAVWLGSGAGAYDFPGPQRSLGGVIAAESLRFVLALGDVEDEDFWQRIGSSLQLTSFVGMHLVGEQPALQRLIAAALPNLRAKSCTVLSGDLPDVQSDPFIWQVVQGQLSLRGWGRHGLLGASAAPRAAATPDRRPTAEQVSRRARNAGVALVDLEATDGRLVVRYGSDAEVDIADDKRIASLTSALGNGVRIRKAATRLRSGQHFATNFDTASSSTRTRATAPAKEVLWASWNLTGQVSTDERAELRDALDLPEAVAVEHERQELVAAEAVGELAVEAEAIDEISSD